MTTMSGKMPNETKAHMDNDYDYYAAKQQMNGHSEPPPPPPQRKSNGGVTPLMTVMEQTPSSRTPPRHPVVSPQGTPDTRGMEEEEEEDIDTDEALLDLAQLEELHQEAERMKALGNKHMAAQVRG
jgi:hypothetical protein